MAALSRLSLNTVTVRDQWSLGQCIEACARHGIPGIAPWRDKLAEYGLGRAVRHVADAGLRVSSLCRGGLFSSGPDALDENRRAIDEAHELGADCLVMVVGGMPPGSRDLAGARQIVHDGVCTLAPYAQAAGVRLGLEPLHPMTCADRSVLSTIDQALDLATAAGYGVGLALDVYHVWWDPDLPAALERAKGHIHGFHVCDWLVPTNDTVFDRGMMGEGVIDIPSIHAALDRTGYDGLIEVEILSRRWWERDPDDLVSEIKRSFERCV